MKTQEAKTNMFRLNATTEGGTAMSHENCGPTVASNQKSATLKLARPVPLGIKAERALAVKNPVRRALVVACLCLGSAITAGAQCPSGETECLLYSFKGPPTDGEEPGGALIRDSQGNFYGTTIGTASYGTVFKLTSIGSSYTESVLYSFKGKPDGVNPQGSIFRDNFGNIYGTTEIDGGGAGSVFELTPVNQESILHSFRGEPDGAFPQAGLAGDNNGNLYGTTYEGGANGIGSIFQLTAGTESVIYSFQGTTDPGLPLAALISDSAGNLYGTGYEGGENGLGAVFELTATHTESVIWSFQGEPDGAHPSAPVIRDSQGNLYGTTRYGGTANLGTVFKLTPTASGYTEQVLYSFGGGLDGATPDGGLVRDGKGNLYGTTYYGGANGEGIVFMLTPAGRETILHTFDAKHGDAGFPAASLVMDRAGNLYGTAVLGGTYGFGAVFEVVH